MTNAGQADASITTAGSRLVRNVSVPSSSAGTITAVVRHATTGAHGHLTLNVDTAAPNKVTNMQLRGATPEEIKGL